MNDNKFIGTSIKNEMEIPVEQLGSPGASSVLIVEPEFTDNRFAGKNRHGDTTTRPFSCKARLSDTPGETRRFNGAFGKNDSSSHILLIDELRRIKLAGPAIEVFLETNENSQISIATAIVSSMKADDARAMFEDALTPWLDKLSYTHQVPIHVAQVVVEDIQNELQYIYFQSPPWQSKIDKGEDRLVERMKPIYALYRESQNASTPFYKVLSLFKIMEGLLNPLRTEILRDLRKYKKDPIIPKLVVPDHPDLAGWLKVHVGKPVGVFVNDFLTNEYRNAIAHFELRNKSALNVSNSVVRIKAFEVAFLADICTRMLIENHEKLLARLDVKND